MKTETGVELAAQAGAVATKVGAATAAASGLAGWVANNHDLIWFSGVLVGVLVGVSGLLVNWYYLHKNTKINEAKRQKR